MTFWLVFGECLSSSKQETQLRLFLWVLASSEFSEFIFIHFTWWMSQKKIVAISKQNYLARRTHKIITRVSISSIRIRDIFVHDQMSVTVSFFLSMFFEQTKSKKRRKLNEKRFLVTQKAFPRTIFSSRVACCQLFCINFLIIN